MEKSIKGFDGSFSYITRANSGKLDGKTDGNLV